MKAVTCALGLVCALAGVPAARADDSTVLIDLCKQYAAMPAPAGEVTSDYIQLKSSCAGYLGSFVRMSRPVDGICRPEKYNIDDLAKAYLAWAEKHPDEWTKPTKVTIAASLADVYPCPK